MSVVEHLWCNSCEAHREASLCPECGSRTRPRFGDDHRPIAKGLDRLAYDPRAFITEDEGALLYLSSLAIRAANPERSSNLENEFRLIERDEDEYILGQSARDFIRALRDDSPVWYPMIRKWSARCFKNQDRRDLIGTILSITDLPDVNTWDNEGELRLNAVLDALSASNSVEDVREFVGTWLEILDPDWEQGDDGLAQLISKFAPVLSTAATFMGHPYVGTALDAAALFMSTGSLDSAPSVSPNKGALALDIVKTLITILSLPSDEIARVANGYVEVLVDVTADECRNPTFEGSEPVLITAVQAFASAWADDLGIKYTGKPDLEGISLTQAQLLMSFCGISCEVEAQEPDGRIVSVWDENNWVVTRCRHRTGTTSLTVGRWGYR